MTTEFSTIRIAFSACLAVAVLIVGGAVSRAQSSGVVRGSVIDANGAVIVGANVTLANASGYRRETMTNGEGRFQFFNVPFDIYTLTVGQSGFAETTREIALRSNVPVEAELTLAAAGVTDQVTAAGGDVSIEPARSEYGVTRASINNLMGALASRQMENLVLSVPGTAKDGEGTFHPRGAHYQASFVIDGVPVSDQLSTVYANNFDARNVEDITVQLGNIAPEFGNKISAVIQVATQSGLGSGRRLFGSFTAGGGTWNSFETGFRLGGQTRDNRFGYFVSGALNRSARFLDAPFQNATVNISGQTIIADGRGLHNNGAGQNLFTRFDFVPNERNFFRLNIALARSRFDVPNLPSQEIAGQDQIQENRNLAIYPSWQHVFNSRVALTVSPYLRISTSTSEDSPGDTPITFDYDRRLPTYGVVANIAYTDGRHQFKTGIDAFAFPVRERFSFQLTDPTFNPLPANSRATINTDNTVNFAFDPALSPAEIDELLRDFNPNLIAFDRTILAQAAANGSIISGAPRRFTTAPRRTGRQFSAYAQDTFTYGRLTVSGGVRFDAYRFIVNENAISPRVGVAYSLGENRPVIRASYNRIVQTPSTENLLISETEGAASLVNPGTERLLGTRLIAIPLERAHWFEVGAQQRLAGLGHIDAAYFRKRVRNLHDNDQFLNTTIIFPIALARGRVDGFDFRFTSTERAGFNGYLSLGTIRVRVRPPFAGGLFLSGATPEDFGAEEFIIDHDQKLNIQGALAYSNRRRGLFAQMLMRHDSGLVTNVTADDRSRLLADPDIAPGVALLNFSEDPVRTRGRTIIDASVAYDFIRREQTRVGVQFDALNLTNRIGLYNYLSVFGGTNYIPSRSFNARLKISF
jgi:hypothetical protein